MSGRGVYIVIEGSDGTGKTTQRDLIKDYFVAHGVSVAVTSEPADPNDADEPLEIAKELRKLVKNGDIERRAETNLHLFAAARVEKWHGEIDPALAKGNYVLSSRNYWSTEAYQGYGEGLDLGYIRTLTELDLGTTGYARPDAAVILAIESEDERAARVSGRGLHNEKDTFETRDENFQRRVANGYVSVAEHYKIPIIDAVGTKQEVFQRILAELQRQLPDFPA
jgi:dTMP kinase